VAPLVPTTASATDAVNLSPALVGLVQILSFEVRLSVVPAAIVPNAAELPDGVTATLFPDAVLVLSGAGADADVDGEDDGARLCGRVCSTGLDDGAGAAGVAAVLSGAGTSFSCGCAALSLFANCRSRLSVVSCASAAVLPLSLLQAPALNATPAASAKGARNRTERNMSQPPKPSAIRRCEVKTNWCAAPGRCAHDSGKPHAPTEQYRHTP